MLIMKLQKKHKEVKSLLNVWLFFIVAAIGLPGNIFASDLSLHGLYVIPYPQLVYIGGKNFYFNKPLTIVLDKGATAADRFAAEELVRDLEKTWGISAEISNVKGDHTIILTHQNAPEKTGMQGYQLVSGENGVIIRASGEEGLFYGTQTLLQLIQKTAEGYMVRGMEITDWPDIKKRAIHYDTKHHQDKASYVRAFIKDLARYKINILVWEWEDKFSYPSHPEVGAPGAFSMEEMREFTRYAQQYHIQIVPLVQGLGHASYILKWPRYEGLREIRASNWEFCPLKKGTYQLLFDLWDDAIRATPGSEYIHIGSDETYELGSCEQCKEKAKEIGKSGLYQMFVNKAAEHLQAEGRKVMVWERPMQWERGPAVPQKIMPVKGLVLTESYRYETPDFHYARKARSEGFEVFAYDPNPGTEALFLPYFYRIRDDKKKHGSLENSYDLLSTSALSGAYDGMISTSWDDAGLHNQMWMLHFINAAEYSWSGSKPTLQEFRESFFRNYYGDSVMDMDELFYLLNEGAYYFMSTFERNVWHYGEIGKTHLPDLPRGQIMEFDPYWNTEYKTMIDRSGNEIQKMERALHIIESNRKLAERHLYDFDIFRTIADLIRHTALTYMDLSALEHAIAKANSLTFLSHEEACNSLLAAQRIIEKSLERRDSVFDDLVSTWGKTRLPKGMSTKDKSYFWQQDRARHFANRRPDMTYLIYDEQLLDMKGYLEKLKAYIRFYRDYYKIPSGILFP